MLTFVPSFERRKPLIFYNVPALPVFSCVFSVLTVEVVPQPLMRCQAPWRPRVTRARGLVA